MVHYLLCVDGSANCDRAFAFLKTKMLKNGANDRLTLIHFVNRIETSKFPISDNLDRLSNITEVQKSQELEKIYKDKCSKSFPDGLQWRYINIVKEKVEDIVDTLKEQSPDIVVCGTAGTGLLKKLVLGSFSQTVVNHSPFPILIVPMSDS